MPLVKACTKSDVSEGSLKSLSVGGKDLVVAMINGKFYAMDNWCTHEQGNLSDGVLTGSYWLAQTVNRQATRRLKKCTKLRFRKTT